METLIIITNGIRKEFMLNVNSKGAEMVINDILDTYAIDDWYVVKGWGTIKLNTPLKELLNLK